MKTFEEWSKDQNYKQEICKFAARDAWNEQQKTIEKMKNIINCKKGKEFDSWCSSWRCILNTDYQCPCDEWELTED